MNTAKDLQARRAKLVADRADCELAGMSTMGVDMAIFNVDRQLQDLLGNEDEPGASASVWGDVVLMVAGVMLLIGAALLKWGPW